MAQKTILLVDDSKTLLMMEEMILKQGPYRLLTAADGLEAVDKARAEQPDLILLDLMMPKLGGLEACRRLKTDASTRDIPVIIVTTHAEAHFRDEARDCGCDGYLTKPITALELNETVRSHLGDG